MTGKINKKWIKGISIAGTLLVFTASVAFLFGSHGTTILRDKSRIGPVVKASGTQVTDVLAVIADNSRYALWFNGTDSSFAVEDKATKNKWYSNPPVSGMDALKINENSRKIVGSQLVIRYMNGISQEIKMDSATFAIASKQYTAQKMDNGVRVTYSFAYPENNESYPRALSTERYDQIISSLSYSADKDLLKKMYALMDRTQLKEEELATLKERYGALDTKNIYILRDGQLNTANRKNLSALFVKIAYTKEQLAKDLTEVGFKGANGSGESFTIPVEYVLEADGLRVSISCKDIRYTESDSGFIPLTAIDLLDFFGCTTQQEDGYLFVPDGSGSLIDFKQKNNRNTTFEGYVYGRDKAILNTAGTNFTENLTMPVYGIKTSTGAMLAVIEEGDAMARIRVSTGGDGIPYNRIGVSFDTMAKDYIPIGANATRENFYVYSNDIYNKTFAVKYYFLGGSDTGYIQMAQTYQKSLLASGKLVQNLSTKAPSVLLELQGAIDVVKTRAGIPYKTTTALTDYADVMKITDTLIENGLASPVIQYTGIYKGGYKTAIQNTFKTDSSLGGGKDLSKMTAALAEKGVTLYAGADFYTISNENIFSSFNKKTDAVRNLTKEIYSDKAGFLLSPKKLAKTMEDYTVGAARSGIEGIAPVDMGSFLYSDFDPNHPILRQESLEILRVAVTGLKNKKTRILSDGANSYMLPFADFLSDVPTGDSGYIISSRSVPFYQMVVHGYLDYSGKPLNYEGEPEKAMLLGVATGSLPSYRLMGKPSYVLNDTDYSDSYASGFDEWKNNLISWTSKTLEWNRKIQNRKMTDYQELASNVTVTDFEGYRVVVNRSAVDFSYNGTVVKAKDCLFLEEEGAK